MVELRPFVRSRLADAQEVVRPVFGTGASAILEKILANPVLRDVPGADGGEIAYLNQVPVGFYGGILRRVYCGSRNLMGLAGSTLCVLPAARKTMAALDLVQKIISPRFSSELFFANSSNVFGMKVNRILGGAVSGPESCTFKRVAAVRPLAYFVYLIRSKVLGVGGYHVAGESVGPSQSSVWVDGLHVRRFDCIDGQVFGEFWTRYLKGNKGWVCSRSPEELNWLFGDLMQQGRAFVAGVFCEDRLCGYVIFKSDLSGRAWRVVDWIAMRNSEKYLGAVLSGGLRLLKRCTEVVHCEITGYAKWVQPIVSRRFPLKRALSNNQSCFRFFVNVSDAAQNETLTSRESWFFGPYDGDACLC